MRNFSIALTMILVFLFASTAFGNDLCDACIDNCLEDGGEDTASCADICHDLEQCE